MKGMGKFISDVRDVMGENNHYTNAARELGWGLKQVFDTTGADAASLDAGEPEWARDQGPSFKEIIEETAFNSGMDEGAQSVGQMARLNEQKEKEHFRQKRDEEKKALFRRILDKAIEDMRAYADALAQRIEEIDLEIAENQRLMDEIDNRVKGGEQAIEHYIENGQFETNPDGSLKNKQAQQLLDNYAKRTGKEPETELEIYVALQKQIEFEKGEKEDLEAKNEALGAERKATKSEMDKVNEAADRLEQRGREIENSNLSEEQKALEAQKVIKDLDPEILDRLKNIDNASPLYVQKQIEKHRDNNLSTDSDIHHEEGDDLLAMMTEDNLKSDFNKSSQGTIDTVPNSNELESVPNPVVVRNPMLNNEF